MGAHSLKDTVSGWLKGRRGDRSCREQYADLFGLFQQILKLNNELLEEIADLGTKLGGNYIFDQHYIHSACQELAEKVYRIINDLNAMTHNRYMDLYDVFQEIDHDIREDLAGRVVVPHSDYTMPYERLSADFAEVVGNKNANLAEVKNVVGLPTPEGFAITTSALHDLLAHEGLEEKIAAILYRWHQGELSEQEAAGRIEPLIKGARLPQSLERAIRNAAEHLLKKAPNPRAMLALRSSATGEDGEHSFAGQFQSVLNLRPEEVIQGYKDVVASTYSARGLAYRRDKGFTDNEVLMAVGCLRMVDAKVSGVLYTLDPLSPQREVMLLSAAWGLGELVVGGEAVADQYMVERTPPHKSVGLEIVRKTRQMVCKEGGSTEVVPVPRELQTASSLTADQARRLAEAGLAIERHFKKLQDIEWAFDQQDRLYILQARPLNIRAEAAPMAGDLSEALESYPVIFRDKGAVVQEGVGAGRVFVVSNDEDLDNFPEHAVLVTRHTSPRLAKVLRKAAALLTDVGSPTGHMATIAREFRVPTIVNTEVATSLLRTGQEVTVDARQNVVYEGTVKELRYYEFSEEIFEETYEYRLLRRVLRKIAPLHLLDPSSKNFTPAACTTFHDIIRFVHEKAVQELIHGDCFRGSVAERGRKRLKCPVPISLILIDIGHGIRQENDGPIVEPEDLVSLPMRTFLQGLSEPGLWSTESLSVDFKSFMSSLTRTFSFNVASPKYVGQNLAVISKEYANISLRLGYHFTMIDAYITDTTNDNHAYFRFLGGVTDISRRSRRANLLAQILGRNDFRVEVRGDLVVARIKKLSRELMEQKMRLLGYLVAFTRQLDVRMISDQEMVKAIQEFNGLQEAIESRLNAGA